MLKVLKNHPILSVLVAGTLAYIAYAKKYEIENILFYPDRPAIDIQFESRSCMDLGPTEYYTVLAVPKVRAENARLVRLQVSEGDRKSQSIDLDGQIGYVEFQCGTFGKPPKPSSWYTVRVEDSLGNVGEKNFRSVSGLQYVIKKEDRKEFDSIPQHKDAMGDWNNRFWNHANGRGKHPGPPP